MLTHINYIVLRSPVLKAREICLEFQPTKCVSLHCNGYRVVPSTQFSVTNGNTVSICNVNCTKFQWVFPSCLHCCRETIFDIHSIHSVISVKIHETMVKPSLQLYTNNCFPCSAVLDLPFLPHFKEFTKLSFIFAIGHSVDPPITELWQSLWTPNCQDVSEIVFDALSAAKSFVSNINSVTFKNTACNNLRPCHVNYWKSEPALLIAQNKFLYIL